MSKMPYIKVYADFIDIAQALDNGQRGRLFLAILEYVNEMELSPLQGAEQIAFLTIKGQIDRDLRDYTTKAEANRENGRKGGRPPKTQMVISETQKTQMVFSKTQKTQEKEKDKEKDKEEISPPNPPQGGVRKFVPPSVEEVKDYCKSRKNSVDAETFVNFYASKGWVIGKSPMKNWQAAVRTWEQKRKGSDYNGLADRGGDAPGGSTKDWGNLQSIPLD
jgi:hypothetical protein